MPARWKTSSSPLATSGSTTSSRRLSSRTASRSAREKRAAGRGRRLDGCSAGCAGLPKGLTSRTASRKSRVSSVCTPDEGPEGSFGERGLTLPPRILLQYSYAPAEGRKPCSTLHQDREDPRQQR